MQVLDSAPACASQSKSKALTKPRDRLANLARQIHAEHLATEKDYSSALDHAMAAGDFLLEAKPHFARGQWTDWLLHSCKIPDRTAQVYMHLARNRKTVKAQRAAGSGSDLSMRGAFKAIAASSEVKAKSASLSSSSSSKSPVSDSSPKKRTTHRDIMEAWMHAVPEERGLFIRSIGLEFLGHLSQDMRDALRRRLGEE